MPRGLPRMNPGSAFSIGAEALMRSGSLSVVLPLIRDMRPDHRSLVVQAVRMLEALIDMHSTVGDHAPLASSADFGPVLTCPLTQAHQMFRELGGFTALVHRLKLEIDSDVATLAEQSPSQQQGQTAPATIPYPRRSLFKAVLRGLSLVNNPSGQQGLGLGESELTSLYGSINKILGSCQFYGAEIFTAACSVVTEFVHQDPMSFRLMDRCGVPQEFLRALDRGEHRLWTAGWE